MFFGTPWNNKKSTIVVGFVVMFRGRFIVGVDSIPKVFWGNTQSIISKCVDFYYKFISQVKGRIMHGFLLILSREKNSHENFSWIVMWELFLEKYAVSTKKSVKEVWNISPTPCMNSPYWLLDWMLRRIKKSLLRPPQHDGTPIRCYS